ncbi:MULTISPECIES: hypothetical protein [Burkholderia]|uniref:hypothetical protein n=1 Tax=Burkholderia TaxID=32008 RepID=UPI00126A1724|nr:MULTISPECIES: hypothetical protein [Burkholderia]
MANWTVVTRSDPLPWRHTDRIPTSMQATSWIGCSLSIVDVDALFDDVLASAFRIRAIDWPRACGSTGEAPGNTLRALIARCASLIRKIRTVARALLTLRRDRSTMKAGACDAPHIP